MKASLRLEMALKEYQLLEEAIGRYNTLTYTVMGIFMGGLLAASAILIPNLVQQDCGPQLAGDFVAPAVIVACSWSWFCGIHLRWRAHNVIMYHRLQELEEYLKFKAHTRIDALYRSERGEPPWAKGDEPSWYTELNKELHPFAPSRLKITYWWFIITLSLTLPYVGIMAWRLANCRWLCALWQSFSGSMP